MHRTLPRQQLVAYLYEYQVENQPFARVLNDVLARLQAPDVDGIYESQCPMYLRILANTATVVRIRQSQHVRVSCITLLISLDTVSFVTGP